MNGTIITITVTYYLFDWLFGIGGQPELSHSYNLLAMLPAGIAGGMQYAATERQGLRWPSRLMCALQSNLLIILAPGLVWMFFAVPMIVLGMGLPALTLLPTLATIMTLSWLLAFLITFLFAIPAIFVGFTFGQWLQFRRMMR